MIVARQMTAIAAGFGLLLLAGCNDGPSNRRAEVHQIIAAATSEIQSVDAMLSDPGRTDEVRRRFGKVIVDLGNTQGAAPGQRAAAAALAAGVHRRLAAISVDDAMQIEAELGSRRTVLIGMIDTVDQLYGMADGLEAIDVDAADATLVAARDDTEESLTATSRQLAELDGPIAELNRDNRMDQDEAQRMRIEAALIRREATGLGAAAGYGPYEEARRIDREADGVELRLAHRELELRYNYEPQQEIAQIKVDRMRDRLESIDATRQQLQDRYATASDEAGVTHAQLDEIGRSIAAGLDELQVSMVTLAGQYDLAVTELDRAASKARAAAGLAEKDFADVTRIEAAQAYQELGSLHRCRARGLQMQVRLMQRVAEVTGATGDTVDIVRDAHQQELGKAAEAYKNAGAELGRVSGRTARQQLEALKMTTESLQGDVAEEPLPSATPARRTARPASPPATTGDGAESPEALMAAMQEDANPVDLYYFGNVTPQQARMVDLFKTSETAKAALVAALRERFADEIDTADGSMLGSMASVNLSLSAVEGDQGTLIRSVGGIEIPVEIVSIDGRWYVDATSSIAEAADQAAALGQDPADLMKAVNTFMGDLAGRIQAGDFDTLQDVDMAFIQGLQTGFGAGD